MEDKIHRGKILVVDDEPLNVELISGFLEKDYEIISASCGKEALEKVNQYNPDIVLLDIMMPEMNGYEVCQKIKSQDSTRFISVVMVTALTEIEEKIKAIESGADDFLTKPINMVELLTRVKSLLKTKSFHDQLIKSKEKIEVQSEFKTIMTDILPVILESIPTEKVTEVLGQMSEQVENILWDKYIKERPEDIANTANTTCNLMNRLGGSFSAKEISQKGYVLINNRCPWSGNGRINPALCMMTKAIFARIGVHIYKEVIVDVSKTIARGDDCCQIELILKK